MNLDIGDAILGTNEALSLRVRGDRVQMAVGIGGERALSGTMTLKYGVEAILRRTQSEVLRSQAIDEDLRMLRGSIVLSKGVPLSLQQRLAVSVTKGFDAFGASMPGNPLGSTPGARTDFLRMSSPRRPHCHFLRSGFSMSA